VKALDSFERTDRTEGLLVRRSAYETRESSERHSHQTIDSAELGERQALPRPGTCRRIDEMRGAPSPEHLGPSFGFVGHDETGAMDAPPGDRQERPEAEPLLDGVALSGDHEHETRPDADTVEGLGGSLSCSRSAIHSKTNPR
jgi:hypothetical protein